MRLIVKILSIILFKIKIVDTWSSSEKAETKVYEFVFMPRMFYFLGIILFMPLALLFGGILGVIQIWRKRNYLCPRGRYRIVFLKSMNFNSWQAYDRF